jgi:hypothetical protein
LAAVAEGDLEIQIPIGAAALPILVTEGTARIAANIAKLPEPLRQT